MNPLKLYSHETALQDVYQVGDTTFPGQGFVGVCAGAQILHESILDSSFESSFK